MIPAITVYGLSAGVQRAGLTHTTAPPGAAIVYTNARTLYGGRNDGQLDAVHLGLVLRVAPVLLSIDGATTIATYDREGFVQVLKPVDQSRVLGYVRAEAER
jgi:hypothetical protein